MLDGSDQRLCICRSGVVARGGAETGQPGTTCFIVFHVLTRFSRHMKAIVAGFLVLCMFFGSTDGKAAKGTYLIAEGDKLRITVFEKADLSGDFRVDPSGSISLPGIGRLSAARLSPAALETLIIKKLKGAIHLLNPRVVVEILEYRPIFILGNVKNPGQYPYISGFSVLQAIAVAGGHLSHSIDTESMTRNSVSRTRAHAELDVLILENWAAKARLARLSAEREARNGIAWPPDLLRYVEETGSAELIKAEQRNFDLRKTAFAGRIKHYQLQLKHLNEELKTLESLASAVNKTTRIVRKEADDLKGLRSKGLIRKSRMLALERELSELRGNRLKISVSILQARQKMNDFRREIMELKNSRTSEINNSIFEIEKELLVHKRKQQAINQEIRALGNLPGNLPSDTRAVGDIKYTIIRNVDGGVKVVKATESSVILPGDVVKVLQAGQPDGTRSTVPGSAEQL